MRMKSGDGGPAGSLHVGLQSESGTRWEGVLWCPRECPGELKFRGSSYPLRRCMCGADMVPDPARLVKCEPKGEKES